MTTDPSPGRDLAAFPSYVRPMTTAPRDGTWILLAITFSTPNEADPPTYFETVKWDERLKAFVNPMFCRVRQSMHGWAPLPLFHPSCPAPKSLYHP